MSGFMRLSIEAIVEPGQFVMADYHDKFRIVPRQKNLSIKNRTFARRDVGIEFALSMHMRCFAAEESVRIRNREIL
jgi:hypothetical protein